MTWQTKKGTDQSCIWRWIDIQWWEYQPNSRQTFRWAEFVVSGLLQDFWVSKMKSFKTINMCRRLWKLRRYPDFGDLSQRRFINFEWDMCHAKSASSKPTSRGQLSNKYWNGAFHKWRVHWLGKVSATSVRHLNPTGTPRIREVKEVSAKVSKSYWYAACQTMYIIKIQRKHMKPIKHNTILCFFYLYIYNHTT